MDSEIKAEWVKRLREPDRKQGTSFLHVVQPDGTVRQCCLDVLCEIAVEREVIPAPTQLDGHPLTEAYAYNVDEVNQAAVLPTPVVVWAGLDADNPIVDGMALTNWNDTSRKTFPQIADKIEASDL